MLESTLILIPSNQLNLGNFLDSLHLDPLAQEPRVQPIPTGTQGTSDIVSAGVATRNGATAVAYVVGGL